MCIGSSSTTSSTAVDDPEARLLATIFRHAIGVHVPPCDRREVNLGWIRMPERSRPDQARRGCLVNERKRIDG